MSDAVFRRTDTVTKSNYANEEGNAYALHNTVKWLKIELIPLATACNHGSLQIDTQEYYTARYTLHNYR